VHDRESAGLLRNSLVYVRADEIPALPEGEYYHHQILGLRVVSDQGQMLGTVVEILETGANDVVVIRPEVGREILVPLVNDFILRIDLQAGVLHVRLVEGLLPGGPPA
jgi:16S rRNA processing protein RimM